MNKKEKNEMKTNLINAIAPNINIEEGIKGNIYDNTGISSLTIIPGLHGIKPDGNQTGNEGNSQNIDSSTQSQEGNSGKE